MTAQQILYVQVVGAANKPYKAPGGAKEMLNASMALFMQSPYAQREVVHFTDSWPIEIESPAQIKSRRYLGFAVPREPGDPLEVEFVNGVEQ